MNTTPEMVSVFSCSLPLDEHTTLPAPLRLLLRLGRGGLWPRPPAGRRPREACGWLVAGRQEDMVCWIEVRRRAGEENRAGELNRGHQASQQRPPATLSC